MILVTVKFVKFQSLQKKNYEIYCPLLIKYNFQSKEKYNYMTNYNSPIFSKGQKYRKYVFYMAIKALPLQQNP